MSEKSGFRPFAGLVIIFTLLISPLIYVEFFVDPYPNSIWALRILNTKYIVHARAELEIDGETLVLERPIRCFDAVDYDYYPSSSPRGDVLGSNSATADTLAGKNSKGRLFALNVKGACAVLRRKMRNNNELFFKHQNLGDYEYLEPVYLSRGDLDTPIVYELFGEKKALKQVDIYYSRTLLREGYHGVKIKELVIWREPMRLVYQEQEGYRGVKLNKEAKVTLKPLWPMYKDWTEYDWFGEPSWYRRAKGNDGLFFGFYGFKFAPSSFDEVIANYYKFNGDDNVMEGTIEHNLAKYASDRKQQIFYLLAFSDFHLTVINRFGLDFFSRDLTPSLHHPLESQMQYQSFVDSFFPCLPASKAMLVKEVVCKPEMQGIGSFWPYSPYRLDARRTPFIVDGKKFRVKDDNLNYHYDVTNNTVYAVEYSEQRFW